jgi:probable O-glycosylation ligase (exosortase A-associated)
MNPHRLTWGVAYDFPFAQIVAIVTLGGLLFTKDRKSIPLNRVTIIWFVFLVWMSLSTLQALVPVDANWEWGRTMKIQLISLVTIILLFEKKHILQLVWVIVLSLGFFGIKGGVFGVLTGGQYRVYGPYGSFIEDNNTLALALIMTIPLMRFLAGQVEARWAKLAVILMALLTAVSVFASQSRGALVGGAAMVLFLVLKSRNKFRLLVPLVLIFGVMWSFMPESWHERMGTISNYEQDSSAMGRVNAWTFAARLAADRPFFGGGYGAFTPELFYKYAPNPEDFHDSHSIYFEVLAEHGFGGLAIFLMLGYFTFRLGGSIIRSARGSPQLAWAADLAAMLQVGLIGYAATGAFLGLAYFDLYYHFIALMIILDRFVRNSLQSPPAHNQVKTGQAVAAGDR